MNRGYREEQMPSRVTIIKWLGVIQLIMAVLLFIITIVLFAVDFEDDKILQFVWHILLAVVATLLAMGAGVSGCSMNAYQGLIHNLSAKNVCTVMSVMNAFGSIFFMIFSGTVMFYQVDSIDLDEQTQAYKTSFGMVVINFILCFFNMLVAFLAVILCVLWKPREYNSPPPMYPSERVVDEPYVVREERMPYSRAYGRYNGDMYSQGYRTAPLAIKY